MRTTRYLLLLLAIYFLFLGGSSRYVTLYQVRVLHHIIVTGVLGLWLFQRIRRGKGLPLTPLNLPLWGVISVWFISALTSLDPRMAIEHIWFPFTYILMFFVLVDYFQRGRGKVVMEVFFFVMVIVIMLTGLEYASWYFGLGIMPNTEIGWADVGILLPPSVPPASLALGISTLVAGFTVPCIFVTTTWALTVRKKAHRRILWMIAICLFLTLLLTLSRGGLLAFIGGLATFAIIRVIQHPTITNRLSPHLIGGLGGIIAVGIMIAFVLVTLPFGIGQSDEGRLDMWRSAVEITTDYPITGVGPGLFGRAYRDYRNPFVGRDKLASAHNVYLNLSSELGIIGILVGAWLGFTVIRTSWQTWKNAKGRAQHLRVEGMFVALVTLAIHSSVDVFTITPINLVLVLVVAYLMTGHRSILDPLPTGQQLPAYILLGITLVFGGLLLNWDRAQGLFQATFGLPTDEALPLIEEAQAIDPHLNLYYLHEAFLLGIQATTQEQVEQAITAYEEALEREPTWDIGWINLASLELDADNLATATEYLQRASKLYPFNSAYFAYAKVIDDYDMRSTEEIQTAYAMALQFQPFSYPRQLPLSEIWWATPESSNATEHYLNNRNLEFQYRVYRVYNPQLAQSLVPHTPQTATEWWVVGQYQFDQGNINEAREAFNQAISLNPANGNYYVSRAKTLLVNPVSAINDLNLAQLYGTTFEYPNVIRAELTSDQAETINLKATALPIRSMSQEFASVLYTRPALFDIYRNMQYPGLGESILIPWYDIAEFRVAQGDVESAIQAYEFILSQAPYESRAQEAINQLRGKNN